MWYLDERIEERRGNDCSSEHRLLHPVLERCVLRETADQPNTKPEYSSTASSPSPRESTLNPQPSNIDPQRLTLKPGPHPRPQKLRDCSQTQTCQPSSMIKGLAFVSRRLQHGPTSRLQRSSLNPTTQTPTPKLTPTCQPSSMIKVRGGTPPSDSVRTPSRIPGPFTCSRIL